MPAPGQKARGEHKPQWVFLSAGSAKAEASHSPTPTDIFQIIAVVVGVGCARCKSCLSALLPPPTPAPLASTQRSSSHRPEGVALDLAPHHALAGCDSTELFASQPRAHGIEIGHAGGCCRRAGLAAASLPPPPGGSAAAACGVAKPLRLAQLRPAKVVELYQGSAGTGSAPMRRGQSKKQSGKL